MAIQTTFTQSPPKAYAGMQGDAWEGTDIATRFASAAVNPGLLVVGSLNTVAPPAGNLTNAQGIVLVDRSKEGTTGNTFAINDAVPVGKKGRFWVIFENVASAVIGAAPFVRHTANGLLTTLGAFRSDAGVSTSAAVLSTAKITNVDVAAGLVEVSIDLL